MFLTISKTFLCIFASDKDIDMKNLSGFKIGLNDESAIVTHYLHNIGTPFAEPFKNEALKLLGYDDEQALLKAIKS